MKVKQFQIPVLSAQLILLLLSSWLLPWQFLSWPRPGLITCPTTPDTTAPSTSLSLPLSTTPRSTTVLSIKRCLIPTATNTEFMMSTVGPTSMLTRQRMVTAMWRAAIGIFSHYLLVTSDWLTVQCPPARRSRSTCEVPRWPSLWLRCWRHIWRDRPPSSCPYPVPLTCRSPQYLSLSFCFILFLDNLFVFSNQIKILPGFFCWRKEEGKGCLKVSCTRTSGLVSSTSRKCTCTSHAGAGDVQLNKLGFTHNTLVLWLLSFINPC